MMRKKVTILTAILIIATMLFACKKKCDCSKPNQADNCDCPPPIEEPIVVNPPADDSSRVVLPHDVWYNFGAKNRGVFEKNGAFWKTQADSSEVTQMNFRSDDMPWDENIGVVAALLRDIYEAMGENKAKFQGHGKLSNLGISSSAQDKADSSFLSDVLGFDVVPTDSLQLAIDALRKDSVAMTKRFYGNGPNDNMLDSARLVPTAIFMTFDGTFAGYFMHFESGGPENLYDSAWIYKRMIDAFEVNWGGLIFNPETLCALREWSVRYMAVIDKLKDLYKKKAEREMSPLIRSNKKKQ